MNYSRTAGLEGFHSIKGNFHEHLWHSSGGKMEINHLKTVWETQKKLQKQVIRLWLLYCTVLMTCCEWCLMQLYFKQWHLLWCCKSLFMKASFIWQHCEHLIQGDWNFRYLLVFIFKATVNLLNYWNFLLVRTQCSGCF